MDHTNPNLQHVGDDRVTRQTPHEVVHGSAVQPRRLAHVHALEESLNGWMHTKKEWADGAVLDQHQNHMFFWLFGTDGGELLSLTIQAIVRAHASIAVSSEKLRRNFRPSLYA